MTTQGVESAVYDCLVIVLQSLLPTPPTKDRRRAEAWNDPDDDDDSEVISVTSQHGRRRPVAHRERFDRVHREAQRLGVQSVDESSVELRVLAHSSSFVDRRFCTEDELRRRPRLVHAPATIAAGRPPSANDVVTGPARRYFPAAAIDRPPATTTSVERRRLPQPLFGPLYDPARHRPEPAGVRPPVGRALPPRRRRVLPPIPSERPHRRRQLPSAHVQGADWPPRPIFVVSRRYESDDDSISV